MENLALVTISLLLITIVTSYKGFREPAFLEKYCLNVGSILFYKDYKRIITSGFLHTDWIHLTFNMVGLLAFGAKVEELTGSWLMLTIYGVALLAGNVLAIYINRNGTGYSAVGASGAICGLIFFIIALFPSGEIGFMFLPLRIPSWLFGTLYMIFTIGGIRSRATNTGHEAHLGGAIVGVLMAIAIFPKAAGENFLIISLLLIMPAIFIYLLWTKPDLLLVEKPFDKHKGVLTHEDKYNNSRRERERELDQILDKINSSGIDSLSRKDREKLESFSK